jgi:hypothetical protein
MAVDPAARISVQQIFEHPWFKMGSTKRLRGIVVGHDRIPTDPEVLIRLQAMAFDPDHVRKCL